jgi:heme oxygenase (biliverdin-IX-beta and delta-forming)
MLKSTARAIRELMDGQRVLSLAVIVDGVPFAGLLPFVVLPNYAGVMVHASKLSRHTKGLDAGGPAAVLLHEQYAPGKDALQIKRASFECAVHPLERKSDAWVEGRGWYLERFPDSRITFNLGDFTLYRLEFQRGLYIGGFGRAVNIEPADIARLAALK